jgi:hypothetical protein
MHARRVQSWSLALLLAVAGCAGVTLRIAPAWAASALPDTLRAQSDSLPGAALATAADSSAAVLPDSTLDVETSLARLDARAAALAAADRRILDELMAAAREMYAAGDIEAAALLVRDAAQFLGERSR